MSEKDTLEKWRRGGQRTESLPVQESLRRDADSPAYEAFNAVDASLYLKIRQPGQPTQRPYYEGLLNVIDDDPHGTNAVLVYSFGMMVSITGRNLSEMIEAIAGHHVQWIQAFDAGQWNLPADKSKPFIEKIEIVVKNAVDAIADAEHTKRKAKA